MTGSSIPGPRDQEPDTPSQDAEHVRAAARLRDQRPGWVITWAAPAALLLGRPAVPRTARDATARRHH